MLCMLRLIPGQYRWSTARMEHLSSSSNFFFNNRDISFWQVIIDTLSRSSLSGPYRFVVLPNPLQTENGVYHDSGSVFFFVIFSPRQSDGVHCKNWYENLWPSCWMGVKYWVTNWKLFNNALPWNNQRACLDIKRRLSLSLFSLSLSLSLNPPKKKNPKERKSIAMILHHQISFDVPIQFTANSHHTTTDNKETVTEDELRKVSRTSGFP